MGKVLSVDIGSAGLTAAMGSFCLNPAKPVVISKTAVEPYEAGEELDALIHSPALFEIAFKRLIQKNKLKVNKVVLTVNSSFFVRELELPIVRESELAEMVRNEMHQYIQSGRNDVVGFTVIGEIIKDGAKYYRIRAAVMDGDVAHSLYKGLRNLKLSPEYLDIGVNTISKLITPHTKINGQDISHGLFLLADIGYNSSTISLFRQGKLDIQRTLNLGTKDIDSAISDDYRISVKDASMLRLEQNLLLTESSNQEEYSALRSVAYGLCEDINKLIQFTGNRMNTSENSSIYLYGIGSRTVGLDGFVGDILKIPTHQITSLSSVEFSDKKYSEQLADVLNAAGAMIRL